LAALRNILFEAADLTPEIGAAKGYYFPVRLMRIYGRPLNMAQLLQP